MMFRSGGREDRTAARSAFWPLFDLPLLLSALHAALVPFWPPLRRWGPVTPAGRAFGISEVAVTLVFCIFAGMVLINNLGRVSAADDAPVELNLGRCGGASEDGVEEPNPTAGQAASAFIVAMGAMLLSLALN
jgi:hypothetical protein